MLASSDMFVLLVPIAAMVGLPGVFVASRMRSATRLLFGVLAFALGVVSFFLLADSPFLSISLALVGMGVYATASAVTAMSTQRPVQRQVRSALGRFEELAEGVARTRGDQRAAAEYLNEQGITIPEARRIVLRCLRGDGAASVGRMAFELEGGDSDYRLQRGWSDRFETWPKNAPKRRK